MKDSIKETIFISSCTAFYVVAILLMIRGHWLEALILLYFGFSATRYHLQRCCQNKCFNALPEEFWIDLALSLGIAAYIAIGYGMIEWALFYLVVVGGLTFLYNARGDTWSFLGHTLWHILAPGLFYLSVIKK